MEDDKQVTVWYDSLSSSYEELYGREQSVKLQHVKAFVQDEKFKLMVDIGCGPGMLLADFRTHYTYAVGIDLSSEMLKLAKRKRTDQVDLVRATARLLPFRDGLADLVVSISTLKTEPQFQTILDELSRVSSQSGILAFTLFDDPKSQAAGFQSNSFKIAKLSDRESLYCIRRQATHTD